jgi:multiple sugar transport system substrate-binding protein
MKRWRMLSLLMVIALLAAACGQDGDDDDAAAPDDNDVTEGDADDAGDGDDGPTGGDVSGDIFALGFGYETGDEIATSRVDLFREQFPDINVEFSESGFDEQAFLTSIAGDDPPDVVNLPRNQIGTYIQRGVLAPLDECIEQQGVDMDVFYEGALEQVTLEGTHYAFPEFFNTRAWILNNRAFEEAGLDPDEVDLSDWEGLQELNEELTVVEDGTLTRIGIDPKLPEFLPLWAWANGSPLLNDDGTQANIDDAGVVEALETTIPLHEPAGGRTAFLDFRDTWDFFGADNQYATDQLAAMPVEQWYLNVLAGVSPDDVDITVRPFETPEGDPITWADGNSWAIPLHSPDPEAACAFAATMVDTDTWIHAAEVRAEMRDEEGSANTGVYTANQEADDVIFNDIVDLSDWPQFEEGVQVYVDNHENAFGLPPSPAAAAVTDAWENAATQAMEGTDAQEALSSAQEDAQSQIDGAR